MAILFHLVVSVKENRYHHFYFCCVQTAEGFTTLLQNVENQHLVSGLSISRGGPKLTHLLFVMIAYFFVRLVSQNAIQLSLC